MKLASLATAPFFTCWVLLLGVTVTPLWAAPGSGDEPMPGEYRIVNGKVDPGTFSGWRLFHTTCYGCHGVGGTGTDLAPDLVERVKTLTPRDFASKVLTRYRIVQGDDEVGKGDATTQEAMLNEVMRRERFTSGAPGRIVMPAWEADPDVNPHVLDLFAYLSARADGKLGAGRPTPGLRARR